MKFKLKNRGLFLVLFILSGLVFLKVISNRLSKSNTLTTLNLPIKSSAGVLLGVAIQEGKIKQMCNAMQMSGAKFARISIPWNLVEPSKGNFTWATLDKVVDAYNQCGIEIVAYIYSRSNWAVQINPKAQNNVGYYASTYPNNINDYSNFVGRLSSRYKGKIKRYAIENEAQSAAEYASSPESYFQLLATAYKTIHDTDPEALVENAPFSSTSVGLLIANDLVNTGDRSGAVNFVNNYFAHYYPYKSVEFKNLNNLTDVADLKKFLNKTEVQNLIKWSELMFENNKYFDVLQIHYYGPWDRLERSMEYFHKKLSETGSQKPIDIWEFGYGWLGAPDNNYDSQAHASELAKLFVTASANGGNWLEQFELTDFDIIEGHPGLYDNNLNPRTALITYRVLTKMLDGVTQGENLKLGDDIYGYRLVKNNSQTIFALWANQNTIVTLPTNNNPVKLEGIDGKINNVNPSYIHIGTSPVFIYDED